MYFYLQDAFHRLYGVRLSGGSRTILTLTVLALVSNAKSSTSSTSPEESEDDDKAIQLHLRELAKECKKKVLDYAKIAHLLSLKHHFRCKEMMKKPSPQHIKDITYSCLSRPVCVS